MRWHLPAEKSVYLYLRYMGTAKFCYPSGFILDCNLSLTQPLNRMQQWVTTGWQRNDLVAVLSHAAMLHSIQDFIFFSFKLSKVIPSHFLDGRLLPSQLGRYCKESVLVSLDSHTGSVRCAELLEVLSSFVVDWVFYNLGSLLHNICNFFFWQVVVFLSIGSHISSVCWNSCCIINDLVGNACFLIPILIFW